MTPPIAAHTLRGLRALYAAALWHTGLYDSDLNAALKALGRSVEAADQILQGQVPDGKGGLSVIEPILRTANLEDAAESFDAELVDDIDWRDHRAAMAGFYVGMAVCWRLMTSINGRTEA